MENPNLKNKMDEHSPLTNSKHPQYSMNDNSIDEINITIAESKEKESDSENPDSNKDSINNLISTETVDRQNSIPFENPKAVRDGSIDDQNGLILEDGKDLAERKQWIKTDDNILNSKLRRVRGLKKIFSKTKLYYETLGLRISIVSMCFAGIIPIISTSSILTDGLSQTLTNIVNIVCGIIAVCIHVVEKVRNYDKHINECNFIINACSDIEADVEDILETPSENRNNPIEIISRISKNYKIIKKKSVYTPVPENIMNNYRNEVFKETKDKYTPELQNDILTDYLSIINDAPIF
jgi:hypothetical protein